MAELIRSLRKPKMAIKSTEDRKLEGKLAEFRKWRTSHPQDKCISITMTPSQFRETTVQRLIEMRPFTFNGDDNVLILQPQIPIDFILRTFAKRISSAMVKAKWLKTQEISSLVPLTTSTIQLEGVWIKCPHAILQVKGTTIPGVIFEGAFQDSHDRLRECAAEWLSKSNGMVRVVITLKLFENDGEIYTRRKRETFDIWSNRCIKAPTVIDAAKIEEWVGSVTGYLEIWRRGKNGLPVCTTGLVNVLPKPCAPMSTKDLVIKITDIFGTEGTLAPRRTWKIDLDLLRETIASGLKTLAIARLQKKLNTRVNRVEEN